MRRIRRTTQFKRDYKRESKGRHRAKLDQHLRAAISLLAMDIQLPDNYRDHALSGNWKTYRDCHIRPDLVLIYRKPDEHMLELIRLGSHSKLSL